MEELSASHIEDSEQDKNVQQNPAEYIPEDTHFDVSNTDTEQQNTDMQLAYELYPDNPEYLAKDLEALVNTTWPDEYA